MSDKKYYAVKEGRKRGIFLNWDDCQEMVKGYKNASYKSFKDPYEAIDFLVSDNQYIDKNEQKNTNFDTIEAYVDGSFNSENSTYGSGVVIIKNEKVLKEISKNGCNSEMISMRNVAGEIEGAMLAMAYCLENGYKHLKLYYDYSGIEKWCTGEWKTNKEGTKNYKQYYDDIKDKLFVEFCKVKAHSGVIYNEKADELAKKSIF